jgi:pyrroline-5-carboxylate reductase
MRDEFIFRQGATKNRMGSPHQSIVLSIVSLPGVNGMDIREKRLAVIGAGNIGQILLERLIRAGVPVDHLVVSDRDPEKANSVGDLFGIRPTLLADEAICAADAILIAVPPKSVIQVLQTFAGWVCPCRLVISFAAAVPLAFLEKNIRPGTPVVRVMPNAPSLVGEGMNPVTYSASVTPEARELVEAILAAFGQTLVVRDDQMNWCVGLSGAVMRSLLPVLEGMIQAGVEAGLVQDEARKVAGQVMQGTAALVLRTDLSLEQIKGLTPMQTIDEAAVAQIFYDAALQAKEKMDEYQNKLIKP